MSGLTSSSKEANRRERHRANGIEGREDNWSYSALQHRGRLERKELERDYPKHVDLANLQGSLHVLLHAL